ncbi:hypothetical protein [Fodinicola acaciae]|uniref:hypothetical protein n=1 Tax=Fodinicola acaciae TaxID=2681555 RepID=UPI0013D2942B|nr:hypothetical protein [Fodinicola acaciae]
MDDIAERYIKLVLALGRHDPDYVDAYYGPAHWREDAEHLTPAQIGTAARAAAAELPPDSQRGRQLAGQLRAMAARADIIGGATPSFDEESAAIYGAVDPGHTEEEFAALVSELDDVLPGTGTAAERYAALARNVVVDPDKLEQAVKVAIAECRERTVARLDLPDDESFDLELVTGQPWSGQNTYLGGARSRIQVNVDIPIHIDRVLDLAGHEGYPGHHVAGVLHEQRLVAERGWLEFTIYPLFSPMALILEGTAMLAVDVAFPGTQRLDYLREVLAPLTALDPAQVTDYHRARRIAERLDFATNEVARRHLGGTMDEAEAVRWLTAYALMTPEQATKRLDFMRRYRAYVINYNLGREVARAELDARGGTMDDPARQWEAFADLILTPGR